LIASRLSDHPCRQGYAQGRAWQCQWQRPKCGSSGDLERADRRASHGGWVPRTLRIRTSCFTDTIGGAGLLAAEAGRSQEWGCREGIVVEDELKEGRGERVICEVHGNVVRQGSQRQRVPEVCRSQAGFGGSGGCLCVGPTGGGQVVRGRTLPDLTAEDALAGPCGSSKLSTLWRFAKRRTSINLTPLESHVSFVGTRIEWKEVSEGKSCGRLEHCRSRQVEIVLAHNDPVMKPETSRAGASSLQSLPCNDNHI